MQQISVASAEYLYLPELTSIVRLITPSTSDRYYDKSSSRASRRERYNPAELTAELLNLCKESNPVEKENTKGVLDRS
jgi:hypothetical protein